MSKTAFSSQDIVNIIQAVKGSGISRLKFGSLEIEVVQKDSWGEPVYSNADPATPAVEAAQGTPLAASRELPKVFDEDQLEQLKLEDPVEYERMLEAKEIADGDTNTD